MPERGPLVIDASALIELLVGGPLASQVGRLVVGHELHAPELLHVEVLSALKGLERSRQLPTEHAGGAVAALQRAPIELHAHRRLSDGAWALRHQCSLYDGFYVALARAYGCPVLTKDARWTRAGDLGVPILTVG